jgi:hypothetical protein
MYRIDGCESSQLIQDMCKSVQSSFDNSSINAIYSCILGKRSPFTDHIRSYIKNRWILGIHAKDIFNEIPHARRPKTAILPKYGWKVKDLIATEARFTTSYIAKCVGISIRAAHTILKRDLKMKRTCARWIPHLFTKEQKFPRVIISKQLLKLFP